ncbi:radical SAM protein [Azospirillum formosense]|uniref:Radical SAM protein n=1 Tax=Azospirillum formosense TaxID=861533 RepID=A0ABX2KMI4_9PROT|nr:radical SAM protein [Azospirillum formosense]MBY3756173.1 radical SAM protein [Azospirillum formosense]NUB17844.1 radical SAM protein [Azospirillum formosense]
MQDLSISLRQAVALHQQGRLAEADAAYRAVLDIMPDHADTLRLWGLVALQSGAAEAACARLSRAIAVNPGSAEALHVLGGAFRQAGDLEKALGSYRRATVLRPVFPECHFNHGNALIQAERPLEAAVAYRMAVIQQPLAANSRLNLAGVLNRIGDPAGAALQARAAVALEPQQPAMLTALGRAETGLGNAAIAERTHGRAFRLYPRQESLAYEHGLALSAVGRIEEAGPLLHTLARSTNATVRLGAKLALHRLVIRCTDGNDYRRAAAVVLNTWDGQVSDGTAMLPMRVRIESSSACNLRCRHCTTGVAYHSTERRLLKAEMFERILRELKGIEGLVSGVMYLGGEPLMNPQLESMIRRLRDETSIDQIHFVTNAMLATEERCRALADCGVEKIYVSIDGRSPEENDAIRRGSHYPTVRRNLNLMRRYLEPAGVQLIISNNVLRRPGDPPTPVVPAFLIEDFPGLPIATNYAYKWPGWTQTGEDPALVVDINPGRRHGNCGAPFTESVIRPNGDVTLCCYDISGIEVMGNLSQGSLADIWNGERYRAVRLAMIAGDEAALPGVCRNCPVYTGEEIQERPASVPIPVPGVVAV